MEGSFANPPENFSTEGWMIFARCRERFEKIFVFQKQTFFRQVFSYGHVECSFDIPAGRVSGKLKFFGSNPKKMDFLSIKVILWTRSLQFRQPRQKLIDRKPIIFSSLSEKNGMFFWKKNISRHVFLWTRWMQFWCSCRDILDKVPKNCSLNVQKRLSIWKVSNKRILSSKWS